MRSIIFIGLTLVTLGCNESEEIKFERIKIIREKEKVEEMNIHKLTQNYNIKYSWDTISLAYTILYDDIIKTKYQLIRKPHILDIYKENSKYKLLIMTNSSYISLYRFELVTSNIELVNQIVNFDREKNNEMLFIVSIKKIQKICFEARPFKYDEEDAYIELELNDKYIGIGELIDIKTIKSH